MDLASIGKLLGTISIHYPAFKKHITDEAGNISRRTAEEWHRLIGFLDFDEAIEKFDKYLMSPDSKYAPDAKVFLSRPEKTPEYFSGARRLVFIVDERGRLLDDKGREWAYRDNLDATYHYDASGRIIDNRGRLIQ